ncbi:hypothetical protein KIN20_016969 [Parelaphostrongylus tenuis]|uniref:Uncharacterized protein n=1 Tax=Parelaphostrongylus tenuis TaxID=148309 RepID=A0AAD5QR46_PARTN|nr:hypothetical protein KIN20_016969 [Parelaphostrongylus tenuis]
MCWTQSQALPIVLKLESLSCHQELESKVETALKMCSKLERLPDVIKSMADEFHSRIVTVVIESIGHFPVNLMRESNTDGSMTSSSLNPTHPNQVHSSNRPRSFHKRRSQNYQVMKKHNDCDRKRPQIAQYGFKQGRYNSTQWDSKTDSESREAAQNNWKNKHMWNKGLEATDIGSVIKKSAKSTELFPVPESTSHRDRSMTTKHSTMDPGPSHRR